MVIYRLYNLCNSYGIISNFVNVIPLVLIICVTTQMYSYRAVSVSVVSDHVSFASG